MYQFYLVIYLVENNKNIVFRNVLAPRHSFDYTERTLDYTDYTFVKMYALHSLPGVLTGLISPRTLKCT